MARAQETLSLAWEQLMREPEEAGASQQSSSNHKLGKVIPLAPHPLAYLWFNSSSRPQCASYFAWRTKAIPMLITQHKSFMFLARLRTPSVV